MKGTLYLFPTPLGDYDPEEVLSKKYFETILSIRIFVVEEIRSARRFLSKVGFKGRIDELSFYELNEHTDHKEVYRYLEILESGENIGLLSEAGLPAVADPGASLVELAQQRAVKVKPFAGPSSLMMALMASGKNGQNFSFNGYLPVKQEQRRAKIRQLERVSLNENITQIIIETPYRNNALLEDLLYVCGGETKITIACNISCQDEEIYTKSVNNWISIVKKGELDLNKRPAVFII